MERFGHSLCVGFFRLLPQDVHPHTCFHNLVMVARAISLAIRASIIHCHHPAARQGRRNTSKRLERVRTKISEFPCGCCLENCLWISVPNHVWGPRGGALRQPTCYAFPARKIDVGRKNVLLRSGLNSGAYNEISKDIIKF